MAKDWDARASVDPLHYTVNSVPIGQWDLNQYLETGRSTVDLILDPFLAEHAVDLDQLTCLEIGCGAGRLTVHLAQRFKHVIGLDVSPKMVRAAAKTVNRFDRRNVEFVVGTGEDLAVADGMKPINFIFSVIVFQHMPPHVQYQYLREAARILDDGGYLTVHMYANHEEYAALLAAWEERRQANELQGWSEEARVELPRYETGMRHAVEREEVQRVLTEAGMTVLKLADAPEPHDFVVWAQKN